MRVALLGHREFASNLAMSLVASRLREHSLSIFLSGEHTAFGAGAPSVSELEHFETDLCDRLHDSAIAGRAQRAGLMSYIRLAELTGRPIRTLAEPNTPTGLALLRSVQPDLLLSLRYRRILHAEAIAVARHGVINWHSGLLPEYQGVMATFWAMQNRDATIGSTVHYIVDKTIDTGPIIGRCPIQCRYDDTYLGNVHSLYVAGYGLVVDAVQVVARSGSVVQEAQRGQPKYYRAPTEADVEEFNSRGHRLFDGGELERLIDTLASS